MSDHTPQDENPDPGWPRHDKPEAPEVGIFVSDREMYRRLGVGPKTGRLAVHALEPSGFPLKQPLFGNKRYWPAIRFFLDRYYGLIDGHRAEAAAADRRLSNPRQSNDADERGCRGNPRGDKAQGTRSSPPDVPSVIAGKSRPTLAEGRL
jgi:hypothetical protein